MSSVKVSVVIPCYNAARYVGLTVASVRRQTLADWEVVVIDDGSSDGSANVAVAAAGGDHRVRVVRQPNAGVAATRNSGFHLTTPGSDYVLFLDADDVLQPTMLATLTAYMDDRRQVGVAYCLPTLVGEDGRTDVTATGQWDGGLIPGRLRARQRRPGESYTPLAAVLGCVARIIPSLALIRRDAFERTPGWDESFGQPCEDTDLFIHLALQADVHYVGERLVDYRRHAGQSTARPDRLATQMAKLRSKWASPDAIAGIDEGRRREVSAAWRSIARSIIPYTGIVAAADRARRGHVLAAGRFAGGAAKSFLRSFSLPGRFAPPVL